VLSVDGGSSFVGFVFGRVMAFDRSSAFTGGLALLRRTVEFLFIASSSVLFKNPALCRKSELFASARNLYVFTGFAG